jgi:hypothetical protein
MKWWWVASFRQYVASPPEEETSVPIGRETGWAPGKGGGKKPDIFSDYLSKLHSVEVRAENQCNHFMGEIQCYGTQRSNSVNAVNIAFRGQRRQQLARVLADREGHDCSFQRTCAEESKV